ncbi:MAG: agglutinin biogenesis protein MshI [Pseudomonadota bacterium]|nr:MAG: agglutinin biogenesis protein MshI [Pseudomonadota bacterium]
MKLFRKRRQARTITGVHLANGLIAAATIDRERGRQSRLLHAECIEISGRSDPERALRAALPPDHSTVNLVMAVDHYDLLLVEAPRVEPSELRAAVRWKVKNLIDFHIDDAVIDVFEIPGQQNRPQGQAMMYAVAARAREIQERIDLLENADCELHAIDITEMAMRNLAGRLDEDVRGVALLYFSDDHGLITLTHQGSLYLSRRLDTGIGAMLEDAAAAFDQITLEIQRSLDYYDSHFGQPPVSALYVLPGFAAHDALIEGLRDQLNVPVAGYSVDDVTTVETALPDQHAGPLLIALGGALRHEEVGL